MLFTLVAARKLKPLDNVTLYLDADITAAGEMASEALENACGVTFTPRAFTETFDGTGRSELFLKTTLPLTVTSVTLNGVAVSPTLYPDGTLYLASGWSATSRRNIVVTGTAGHATCPARVARAALLLAKRWLVDSPVNDRTTVFTNYEGATERFVTAGVGSALFDIPEANAVVAAYSLQAGLMVA